MIRVAQRLSTPITKGLSEGDLLHEFRDCVFPGEPVRLNVQQHKGCAVDGWIGEWRIEMKHDLKSKDTGNVFVEVAQTDDNWATQEPSGVNLETDLFVMAAYAGTAAVFVFASPAEWRTAILPYPRRRTRAHIHTNVPGMFAEGHLVPVSQLVGTACHDAR